ncbi:SDR family NAD(P)-dependent oxidoreductase [Roseicitreum antarcticum]|uniref:3-oxoacyl-[acyl-carrier protein] reductase n=1 Tax=Roseicitreum antarcticum TaxID=564137 RepID=A0A1H3D0M1_9RHOB|nr:SDR family oxidoreductase [Roseicitreum antarcticum]SDX59840.1 3-oxoacyl-[acyl-carrier protein] reductase [Roseicitreum antarcticum]
MTDALLDQRVVITGAAQGLGAAIARVFAKHGAELVLMDVDAAGLDAVNASIGGGALCLIVDLGDAAATADAIAAIPGPVGTLIHNAAILKPEPLDATSLATFTATMNVGIQAAFQLSQAFWGGMKAQGGGALIFVSSQSGIKGFANETAYCAAKHALEGFSKCLALEGEAHGILSCTITPGRAMHTPMSERNYPPALKAQWIAPDLLAPAFVHIATTRDAALSGQRLNAWEMSQQQEPPQ